MAGRITGAVRRKGVRGVARIVTERARRTVFLRETYIWYELDLTSERPRRELPEGARLVSPQSEAELALFDRAANEEPPPRPERAAAGGLPWVVIAGGEPAFACWTFLQRTPVSAMPGGWLELPEGVACLEDSVTSPDFRGKGIAPGAWTAAADEVTERGKHAMITKVQEENIPSRRAVEKAGFREVALLDLVRVGPRLRLSVRTDGQGTGRQLKAAMHGHQSWTRPV
jgi:GNAT superfamily N-acetyltransferase